VNYEHHMCEDI